MTKMDSQSNTDQKSERYIIGVQSDATVGMEYIYKDDEGYFFDKVVTGACSFTRDYAFKMIREFIRHSQASFYLLKLSDIKNETQSR